MNQLALFDSRKLVRRVQRASVDSHNALWGKRKVFAVVVGETYGLLTVVSENNQPGVPRWACRCVCGKTLALAANALIRGHTKSCGCAQRDGENIATHGHSRNKNKSPTYRSWQCMLRRCGNKNDSSYCRYGARGVTVCRRWLAFENFLSDMGKRPFGTSLDRILGTGNYEPSNCRWATAAQQAQNTTRAKLSSEKAAEIRSLQGKLSGRSVAKLYGVSHHRIWAIWSNKAWL